MTELTDWVCWLDVNDVEDNDGVDIYVCDSVFLTTCLSNPPGLFHNTISIHGLFL